MTITSHSLIFIDLFLALRNPFYPRQKRWAVYKIVLFIIFSGFLLSTLIKVSYTDVGLKLYNYQRNKTYDIILLGLNYSILCVTLGLLLASIFLLAEKGTSSEVRHHVIRKYSLLMVFYFIFIVNFTIMVSNLQIEDIAGLFYS